MISGLDYIVDYVSVPEEKTLLDHIDQQDWLTDLKRRVQHYGYKYDYTARSVTKESYLGSLPSWLTPLAQKLGADQVIINEYLPGQGISAHIDCVPCFGEKIASLSLGSDCIMQFYRPDTGEKEELVLEQRSLIILSGDARYKWQHAIPARKSDIINGIKTPRNRRVSLTFRKVMLGQP